MGPKLSWQTITAHILPNILRAKANQTMKFIQVLENNKRNGFFKNNAENETSSTSVFVF